MDCGLKTLLLLALCTLAKTDQNNVLEEQEALAIEKETKADDSSLKYRNITLNVTICIPKHGNDGTAFTTVQEISGNTLQLTATAAKPGPKTPCNSTSCMLDNVPELAVYVFEEEPEKYLVCSTNVTNEDFFMTINTSTSEITITTKKNPGTLNSAMASVDVVGRHFNTLFSSSGDSVQSLIFTVEQTLIPTTKAVPTTKHVPSSTKNTVGVTSKQTTHPPVRHSTITQETGVKPVVTSPKPTIEKPSAAPIIGKASSLGYGALWAMVLLVLIQIFLN